MQDTRLPMYLFIMQTRIMWSMSGHAGVCKRHYVSVTSLLLDSRMAVLNPSDIVSDVIIHVSDRLRVVHMFCTSHWDFPGLNFRFMSVCVQGILSLDKHVGTPNYR